MAKEKETPIKKAKKIVVREQVVETELEKVSEEARLARL